jgi:hypothetical protein
MLNEAAIPEPADSAPPVASPEMLDFYAIPLPPEQDPDELIKHRFLCRGGALLLVGQSGIGKSSFTIQCAVLWSLGREAFGLVPVGPLRILIVQAENDPGDMAEFRDGVLKGLDLKDEDCKGSVIKTVCEDSRTGAAFCSDVLQPLLEREQFDLVIVDPALAYLGGDANQQKDVSMFLRNCLNPVLHRARCGLVLVHHTNKPSQYQRNQEWQANDYAYAGSGSADWANWARAVLVIRTLGSFDYFELRAGKRGKRLRWKDKSGKGSAFTKHIGHSQTGICWREVPDEEILSAPGIVDKANSRLGPKPPPVDDFMALFPHDYKKDPSEALLSAGQIQIAFRQRGWSKNHYSGMCDNAVAQGILEQTSGGGKGGKVLRGRPDMVEAYLRNKQEKGTILENVPIAKPPKKKKRTRKSKLSKSS